MKRRATWLTGGLVLSIFTAIAANGSQFIEAIQAGYMFLKLVSHDKDWGVGSGTLVLVLCTLAVAFLRRWLPDASWYPAHARTFLIETTALVLGLGLMWLIGRAAVPLMVGTVAGLAAPYLYRLIAWACCLVRDGVAHAQTDGPPEGQGDGKGT